MTALRNFLAISWLFIMGFTIYVVTQHGLNWPVVFFGDMFTTTWRGQFNADFLIHVVLLCGWIYWREASKLKGAAYVLLSSLGGMFTIAYLLVAAYKAKGDVKVMLLGTHATPAT